MADGSNVLDEARSLIEQRLKELDDERNRLERALAGLSGTRRGPGRPRSAAAAGRRTRTSASGAGGKRRRRRRGGTRGEQALKHVAANPGIRASEIADKLSIKPNYVYRVMSELQGDGKVTKEGRGYKATAAPKASAPAPGGGKSDS